MKRSIIVLSCFAWACVPTTGGQLVSFTLEGSGDPKVVSGGPLTFTTPRGFEVTLTEARLTVGGVYFNQQNPQNYTLDQTCVQTGIYTGEVRTGLTIDALDPTPHAFPLLGQGTDRQTLAAELWLTGGDVLADTDDTAVLTLAGTARRGTDSWPFDGAVTISSNRVVPANPALPGSNPLCKQRIIAPIAFAARLQPGATVSLFVDPRAFVSNVDFSALTKASDAPLLYRFADETRAGPEAALYSGLRNAGAGGPYRFEGSESVAPADAGVIEGSDAGLEVVPHEAPMGSLNRSLLVTVSGESAAIEGLSFPPASSGVPYMLDGWQLDFDHVIVTVANVTLSDNPDLNPNDPSQSGAPVARAEGAWAVDLAKGGPLDAKEQNGKAIAITRLTRQNLKTGAPEFDTSAKYAFGYDLIVPRGVVQNVNLDADALNMLASMNQRGWAVWMHGTATWRGDKGTPACRQTVSSYDFNRLARSFTFSLGFATPVTFKNCVNPDLSPAESRGVQLQSSAQTLAQVTFHLDHPFWESLSEDAPLRLDALASLTSDGSTVVTQEQLIGRDFQAVVDAQGVGVPWRTCGPALPNERQTGTLSLDAVNVPVSPLGGAAGLKDLYDYMSYNLSTFGHLNNDGLCFPSRQFAAPQ